MDKSFQSAHFGHRELLGAKLPWACCLEIFSTHSSH